MKWWNGYRMRLILTGFVTAMVLGGGSAKADFTFGEPIELGPPIWSQSHDPQGCCFSRDGLELYFCSNRPGGFGGSDIWVATRERVDASWEEPVNLGTPVNNAGSQIEPAISPDSLELYFGDWSDWKIRVCKRPSKEAAWSSPEFLGPPIGLGSEGQAEFSADGLSLYFNSKRSGGYGKGDIWVSTRATTADPWGEPTNLGPNVNTSASEGYPSISSDGKVLFFNSDRPGIYNTSDYDIWMTTRATESDPWGPPVNCDIINNSTTVGGEKFDAAISPDGSVLYFERGKDMWQSTITPIVDFNGDGIVDAGDVCIIVDNWGTDNSLCDIGPMPWGDGIVDVQDLIVLAGHLFDDYRALAQWKLDEKAGDIAHDSVGGKDATLHGNPVWQPASGQIGGALEFGGNDDYISTPFVLNPGNGSLSTFTWIKGGQPGQVIISQTGEFGGTWLGIDPSGKLMTGFSDIYFGALVSETVITDVQWHHVAFVYDMDSLHRQLYVDGVLVAEDATVVSGMPSDGGLYIGASKDLDAGTFFSGMIDDVRIYNQALTAEEIAALSQ